MQQNYFKLLIYYLCSLECQDSEIKMTAVNKLWFGGDLVRIAGKCTCSGERVWDSNDLKCDNRALFYCRQMAARLGLGNIC